MSKEYVLTVHARERNPEYTPNNFQAYQPDVPEFLLSRMMEVTIREDEFNTIKQALVEHWQL